jgi:hypothetical protein
MGTTTQEAIMPAYTQPALFDRLIALLTEATLIYLTGQIEAGAEAVMLFDSWAGILPPSQFHRHVVQPTKAIRAALRDRHPAIPDNAEPSPAVPAAPGLRGLVIDAGLPGLALLVLERADAPTIRALSVAAVLPAFGLASAWAMRALP